MQDTLRIKGQCPECGYFFEGFHKTIDGAFVPLHCPKCHEEVENFDEAEVLESSSTEEMKKLDHDLNGNKPSEYNWHETEDFIKKN